MKHFVLPLLLLFVNALAARGGEGVAWESDFDKAMSRAQSEKRPLLLDFTAAWCGPCRMMDTTTFVNADVQSALSALVPVKVNVDAHPQIAARYKIRPIPALVLVNPAGEEVSRILGYTQPGALVEWLESHRSEALATTPKAEQLRQDQARLFESVRSQDDATRSAGLQELFGQVASNDPAFREMAIRTLAELARGNSAALQPYLRDKRLIVRIAVSNALETEFGENLENDPWQRPP